MSKVERGTGGEASQFEWWAFKCPGCDDTHHFYTKYRGNTKFEWTFNGDVDKPTFTPSLLLSRPGKRCHLFVTDGKIIYCGDCDHKLAGQTVPMEDLP